MIISDKAEAMQQYLTMANMFANAQRNNDFVNGNEPATAIAYLGKLLREDVEGQQLLASHLNHDDPYVRVWIAGDCLFFKPDVAIPVLEAIEKTGGLLGTSARMTLSEWRAGRL